MSTENCPKLTFVPNNVLEFLEIFPSFMAKKLECPRHIKTGNLPIYARRGYVWAMDPYPDQVDNAVYDALKVRPRRIEAHEASNPIPLKRDVKNRQQWDQENKRWG